LSVPDNSTPSARGRSNGVSPATQNRLDRLARDHPELRRRVIAGELSVGEAMIEAGLEHPMVKVPRDDPEAAGEALIRHFAGERLDALIAGLVAARGGVDITRSGG
jgi:hypothetical protein